MRARSLMGDRERRPEKFKLWKRREYGLQNTLKKSLHYWDN
jgi:hypothetical protein